MEQMKPCPWCGADVHFANQPLEIFCEHCSKDGKILFGTGTTVAEAIRNWNMKASREEPSCSVCGGWYDVQTYAFSDGTLDECAFCANSAAGKAARYPGQYENRTILFTLSAQMNVLLRALRERT